MLKFEDLVLAIRQGAEQASAVMDAQWHKTLDNFFDAIGEYDPDDPKHRSGASEEDFITYQRMLESRRDGEASGAASRVRKRRDGQEIDEDDRAPVIEYRPKMVALSYPSENPNDLTERSVLVPLISVVPVSNLRLEELEMEMEVEITLDQDENLSVGFIKKEEKKRDVISEKQAETDIYNAKIKMKFGAGDLPDGVQMVLEGYDKAMRAQIPG